MELAEKEKLTYIAPFDDPDVIAGQGTVGMEIVRQRPDDIHAIFVPIGGGGLAAGVAAFVKQVRPSIKVIGVQTHDSCCMKQSVEAGKVVSLKDVGLFSDGTAVKASAKKPSASAAISWTTSSPLTPTPSAAPSKTSSTTPAASPNPPARSPLPA